MKIKRSALLARSVIFASVCFLAAGSLSAGTLYSARGIDLVDGQATNAPHGRVILTDAFGADGILKSEIGNYQNLLKITFGAEYLGEKCLVVSGEELDKIDTAWSVKSERIPLPEKAPSFTIVFETASDAPIKATSATSGNHWRNAICWFNAAGEPCGEQIFHYVIGVGKFGETSVSGEIPQEAASFSIQFGFDIPNVDQGNRIAFSRFEFSLVDSESAFTKEGTFDSEIFPGGDVSWVAVTPEGTSVKFQLASAPDQNGEPGEWSEFLGPDGTNVSWYTKPFHADAAFARYRACLVPNGRERPTLCSVTAGDQCDQSWTRRQDQTPPRVRIVSETPTLNHNADVELTITDSASICWKSLQITIDGRDATSQSVRTGNRLLYKATEPWSDGLHTVTVEIADHYGNAVTSKKCFYIGSPPTTPKITLRDDGMTLIDGKPFFPIGLYGVMKREFNDFDIDKAFKDLKAAGFNFAHSYSMPRSDEFLAAALKYDIKLWTAARFPDERFIEIERNHPAIIAWYLGDDTSGHATPSELFDRDDAVKAVDPTRITTQADGVSAMSEVSNYFDYVGGTDNFLPEIYPVQKLKPDDGPGCVARTIVDMERCRADIAASGTGTRSLWPIIQYFKGWGWERFPTNQELRGMSFAALIHGAHGITWYTYGGTVEPEKKKFNYGVTSSPEVWGNITTLAAQINGLIPVLIERTPAEQPTVNILDGPAKDVCGNPSISCLRKNHDGFVYLLTVNAAAAPVRAEFSLPELASGEVLFEDRAVALTDGKLVDSFDAQGVHVYKLK